MPGSSLKILSILQKVRLGNWLGLGQVVKIFRFSSIYNYRVKIIFVYFANKWDQLFNTNILESSWIRTWFKALIKGSSGAEN